MIGAGAGWAKGGGLGLGGFCVQGQVRAPCKAIQAVYYAIPY